MYTRTNLDKAVKLQEIGFTLHELKNMVKILERVEKVYPAPQGVTDFDVYDRAAGIGIEFDMYPKDLKELTEYTRGYFGCGRSCKACRHKNCEK